jgi:hypothetical protein
MGYLVWAGLAAISGAGAIVSGGYGNHEFMAIAAAVVVVALIGACVSRIARRPLSPDDDLQRD